MKCLIMIYFLRANKIVKFNRLVRFVIGLCLSFFPFLLHCEEAPKNITVALVKNHHPLSFELPNGQPAGLMVDIWQQWSKTTGIQVKFTLTSMQIGLQLVKNKTAVHGGLFRNKSRESWADFSLPFNQTSTSVFYKEFDKQSNNKKTLKDFEGDIVAVLPGSYHEQYLIDNFPKIKRVEYENTASFIQLLNDEIQAIFDETPAMDSTAARLGMTGVFESNKVRIGANLVHAVIAKGQPLLLETINRGFESIPLDILISLDKKWLPSELPFFKDKAHLSTLTLTEQRWLLQHPTLLTPVEVNAYPYSFKDSNETYSGAWIDYLNLISQSLNVNIEAVGTEVWNQGLAALKIGEADFIIGIAESPERRKHFNFTQPFFHTHNVIVMKKGNFFVESMSSLNGKKLGIISGYIENELVKRDFPEIDIISVSSISEGMSLVNSGEIDAYIGLLDIINRELSENKYTELIIALMTPYDLALSIGVNKELKLLVPIFNKALDNIDEKAKAAIGNNWLSTRSSEGVDIEVILSWAVPILSFLSLIILITMRGNRKLKNEIKQRKEVEKERERLESQLLRSQKMEAVGSLAGGIAHDFNNILGIIMGNVELSKVNLQNTEKTEIYIDNIYQASERARKLVSHIMTFSSMNIPIFQPLRLSSVVNECIQLIKSTSPANIDFFIDINPNESFIINGDETQISQVIINLCTNSIHAMQESGGRLTISLQNSSSEEISFPNMEGSYYSLSISDNGTGIDKAILNSIFDPFFSTKGVGEGTGLGLSVVHNIVKNHQGDIIVESVIGQGSSFIIFLPRSDKKVSNSAVKMSAQKSGGGKILVVEDEEDLRGIYKEQLERLGYQVMACANGQDALKVFKKKPKYFDFVLSDHSMPGMTGSELAKEILTIRPNLPIIIATGYADLMSADELNSLGVYQCLVKPVNINVLNESIQNCLKDR